MKKLGEGLLTLLNKKYAPDQLVTLRFGQYDVAMKTDQQGNPVLAFVGKADQRGIIKGDKYARRLLKNETGAVIKDHWDYKGII